MNKDIPKSELSPLLQKGFEHLDRDIKDLASAMASIQNRQTYNSEELAWIETLVIRIRETLKFVAVANTTQRMEAAENEIIAETHALRLSKGGPPKGCNPNLN